MTKYIVELHNIWTNEKQIFFVYADNEQQAGELAIKLCSGAWQNFMQVESVVESLYA